MVLEMKKKPKLSTVKKKAWKAFSLYIRIRSLEGNLITCYTCDNQRPIGKITAGHGISGRTNAVLFMEEVVRPQCIACNVFNGGRYWIFTPKLIEELGMKKYSQLAKQAKKTVKYTIQDYLDIEKKYKNKLDKLTK
jgi:hypothetical protein